MRRTFISSTAVAATAALALGAAGSGPATAAKGKRATTVACTFELFAQGPPQGTPPSVNSFGLVDCGRPLGDGVHYGAAGAPPPGATSGPIAVRFKKYFDEGTITGTVAGTFAATSVSNIITYEGTVTVTGGTGSFKRVKGGGRLRCTSSNGGPRKSCSAKLKLTGI
jgi:hypothetical protein